MIAIIPHLLFEKLLTYLLHTEYKVDQNITIYSLRTTKPIEALLHSSFSFCKAKRTDYEVDLDMTTIIFLFSQNEENHLPISLLV